MMAAGAVAAPTPRGLARTMNRDLRLAVLEAMRHAGALADASIAERIAIIRRARRPEPEPGLRGIASERRPDDDSGFE